MTMFSITQHIYRNLHDNGLFRLETADQTYCEDDKLFLADRFVEGTCPQCGYEVDPETIHQQPEERSLTELTGRSRRPVRQMLAHLFLSHFTAESAVQAQQNTHRLRPPIHPRLRPLGPVATQIRRMDAEG